MLIEVRPFDGLLIEFAQSVGANVIVRGLRAVSDFDYEFQMAGMNYRLAPDIETVFLMASERHQFISSRLVKEIAHAGRRHLLLRAAADAATHPGARACGLEARPGHRPRGPLRDSDAATRPMRRRAVAVLAALSGTAMMGAAVAKPPLRTWRTRCTWT